MKVSKSASSKLIDKLILMKKNEIKANKYSKYQNKNWHLDVESFSSAREVYYSYDNLLGFSNLDDVDYLKTQNIMFD